MFPVAKLTQPFLPLQYNTIDIIILERNGEQSLYFEIFKVSFTSILRLLTIKGVLYSAVKIHSKSDSCFQCWTKKMASFKTFLSVTVTLVSIVLAISQDSNEGTQNERCCICYG